jgi:hypothetical protein
MPQDMTTDSWQEVVRRKVGAIRFGSVQITVHEGRVTQVEAVEKTRFAPDKQPGGRPAKS